METRYMSLDLLGKLPGFGFALGTKVECARLPPVSSVCFFGV